MTRSTWVVGAVVVALALAGGYVAWDAFVWTPRASLAAAPSRAQARVAAEDRPTATRAHPRARPPARPPRRAPPAKTPRLPPTERADARIEVREELSGDLEDRLYDYADAAGWDAYHTEVVRRILVETTTHISETLARIDRGQGSWEQERADLRQYRLDQAAKVEAFLGEDFGPFVQAMGFERFFGEEPVRGRLE